MNIPFAECHKTGVSSAGPDEIDDRARTPIIVREPLFAKHGTETGTKTGGEAGEPEAVNCNGDAGGPEGSVWVGYISGVWVSTVQNLVEEYG